MTAKSYRCLKPFSYPASLSIRDRIRAGDHMPLEKRGEWRRYVEGDRIANPPSDLIESWLRRGCVEPISITAKKSEASDDTPK